MKSKEDTHLITKVALQVAIAVSVIITAYARFFYEGFQWYYYLIFGMVWIPLWILYDLNEHKRKQND